MIQIPSYASSPTRHLLTANRLSGDKLSVDRPSALENRNQKHKELLGRGKGSSPHIRTTTMPSRGGSVFVIHPTLDGPSSESRLYRAPRKNQPPSPFVIALFVLLQDPAVFGHELIPDPAVGPHHHRQRLAEEGDSVRVALPPTVVSPRQPTSGA